MMSGASAPDEALLPADDQRPVHPVERPSTADRVYSWVASAGAISVLVILALIGVFLLVRAWPALTDAGWSFFTTTTWDAAPGRAFGIAALMWGTIVIALIALVIAIPAAIGSALYLNEYAPRSVRAVFVSVIDLMAAVPSLVYGLWGALYLRPRMVGISRWLNDHLGFLPIFRVDAPVFGPSPFTAGVVVSLMVLPIAASVIREVFAQAPPGEKEGALALGATRWTMIRAVVLPFGRGGIIGGAMLGLGRALGETIAVALIISPRLLITPQILEIGGASVAANIVTSFADASQFGVSALIASGLALFLLTLAVNTVASLVVARSRSGAGVEL